MKIIVTGSLGNISKPLTKDLVQKGHAITVISSKPEKQQEIEALGATAAIGSLDDLDFLIATFTGADAVYCMIPPSYFQEPDVLAYYRRLGNNYARALEQTGVKRAVDLSSCGADLDKGTGIILGSYFVENILDGLPGTDVIHVRPGYFYYNLYNLASMIKTTGNITVNFGGSDKMVLVSPQDIAVAIAEALTNPGTGNKVRYVASDELTANEVAEILGIAIGKPGLKWQTITDEEMKRGLETNGLPPALAGQFVEMYASIHSGKLYEDYFRNRPGVLGTVKMADFASEFAVTFSQNN